MLVDRTFIKKSFGIESKGFLFVFFKTLFNIIILHEEKVYILAGNLFTMMVPAKT